MDSPSSTTRIAARSSVIDSFRSCALSGMRIDKEELRRRLSIPEYLRHAMHNAVKQKNVDEAVTEALVIVDRHDVVEPELPVVVFVNSRSGGRHGPELKERLQQLMAEEQVSLPLLLFNVLISCCVFAGDGNVPVTEYDVPVLLPGWYEVAVTLP